MALRLRLVKDKTNINFVAAHKVTLALGLLMVVTTAFLLFTKGLNLGIDFTGGLLIEARKPATMTVDDIRGRLAELPSGVPQIQEFGDDAIMIKVPGREIDKEAQKSITSDVQQRLGAEVEFRRVEYVGPQVGKELIKTGLYAVLWAKLGILLYIWARFEWQFGLAALVGLFHDGVAAILFFILTRFEFDLSTVAAILLIAGYSINETVVIFDRIREQLRKYRKLPMPDLINLALNETLSRTVTTSITTFICMASLAFFGTAAIKGFCYAMLVGIFFGPFSSIFISTPLLLYMNIRRGPAAEENGAADTAASQAS